MDGNIFANILSGQGGGWGGLGQRMPQVQQAMGQVGNALDHIPGMGGQGMGGMLTGIPNFLGGAMGGQGGPINASAMNWSGSQTPMMGSTFTGGNAHPIIGSGGSANGQFATALGNVFGQDRGRMRNHHGMGMGNAPTPTV